MDQKVRRGVLPDSWSLKQGVGPHTSRFPPNLPPFQSRSGRGLFSCKPTSSHLVALVMTPLETCGPQLVRMRHTMADFGSAEDGAWLASARPARWTDHIGRVGSRVAQERGRLYR